MLPDWKLLVLLVRRQHITVKLLVWNKKKKWWKKHAWLINLSNIIWNIIYNSVNEAQWLPNHRLAQRVREKLCLANEQPWHFHITNLTVLPNQISILKTVFFKKMSIHTEWIYFNYVSNLDSPCILSVYIYCSSLLSRWCLMLPGKMFRDSHHLRLQPNLDKEQHSPNHGS